MPAQNDVLWCDLDGEFLTPEGFTRITCSACPAPAVVRTAAAPLRQWWCRSHLPEGVSLPGWMRASKALA